MPISAALRQGPYIKVATVASRWQLTFYFSACNFGRLKLAYLILTIWYLLIYLSRYLGQETAK